MTGCPHDNILDCPLYHALHDPGLVHLGCDDGRLGEGGCACERELSYHHALGKLRTVAPRFVAEVEWNAARRAGADQARRNQRLSGVH